MTLAAITKEAIREVGVTATNFYSAANRGTHYLSLLSGEDFAGNDSSSVKYLPVVAGRSFFNFNSTTTPQGGFRQPAVFHLMNEGRTVFAQLFDFLPKTSSTPPSVSAEVTGLARR